MRPWGLILAAVMTVATASATAAAQEFMKLPKLKIIVADGEGARLVIVDLVLDLRSGQTQAVKAKQSEVTKLITDTLGALPIERYRAGNQAQTVKETTLTALHGAGFADIREVLIGKIQIR